ncbi:MAG: protein kinase domain-containing protein, partial [Omnitrophica WOR_2 bacterium]
MNPTQEELPGGTVTFLFTDIQGSTELLKKLGERYASLLSEHYSILRQIFNRYHGREVDTQGDAFFVSFPRATDALSAVVEAQRELYEHPWVDGVQVRVRMGLHTGEPWLKDIGYTGMSVHRAARIAHVAYGGQVLLSETTAALVRDELPEGVGLLDLGSHRLKDMRRPEYLFQLVIPGLPSEFPPLKTLEALPETPIQRTIRGYELRERLGTGTFGEVFRAVQSSVKRDVALKAILPRFANTPEFVRRFEIEAQVIARLEHPHIVPLYDYWREPDGAYLVMRWLRGGSLQDALAFGPWNGEPAARLVDQVAAALSTAHNQGVIHRDIKPANILLDETGNAYLSDFGIATLSGPMQALFDKHSDLEKFEALHSGEQGYQSPEVALGKAATPQADLYSLGVVLYQLVTGQHPFPGLSGDALLEKHLHDPLPSVRLARPDLPAAVDDVIQRATAKDASQRYQDALTLAADFRRALSGDVIKPAAPLEIVNPYKGLNAFQEADAQDFFGREDLSTYLLSQFNGNVKDQKNQYHRFLAVVGPSGSGKSSVVRAGVIPALRKGGLPGSENWYIVQMLPGDHPLEELEIQLLKIGTRPDLNLRELLCRDERGLLRAARLVLPEDGQLLLIIDQFEEVFTRAQDKTESGLFLNTLYNAVTDRHSQVRVIVTLRADFYDRPLMHPDFSSLLRERTEVVVPLNAEELERAIRAPAERVGVSFEPGLVSKIVADIIEQPGALPLLQYALTELFERRDGTLLTSSAYREIGGVFGALGRRAEEFYAALDESGKTAARQLFLRLVMLGEGTEDTRRRVLLPELESIDSDEKEQGSVSRMNEVIELFGQGRLLSFDRDPSTRTPTVEVAHEALLREWARLRGWLDESRSDIRIERSLGQAAAEWSAAGKEPSFLLSGARLDQVQDWQKTSQVQLTAQEREYLETSIAEHERRLAEEAERSQRELEAARKLAETEKARAEEGYRSARQLRRWTWYLAGLLVLAGLAALLAFTNGQRARSNLVLANKNLEDARISQENLAIQQSIAETEVVARTTQQALAENEAQARGTAEANALSERDLAQARELAASSVNNILNNGDAELSALLALQSLKLSYSPEAESTLRQALLDMRKAGVLEGRQKNILDLRYSPDGKRLASTGDDGTVQIWDVNNRKLLLTLTSVQGKEMTGADFSPDGSRIATMGTDNIARVWDASSGKELVQFPAEIYWSTAPAFSPDGKLLATPTDTGSAFIWNAATGERVATLSGHQGSVVVATFSPDGTRLVTLNEDKTAVIWDVKTWQPLRTLTNQASAFSDLAYSPDGSRLALAGNTEIRIYDPASGQVLLTIPNAGMGVTFSPDGSKLASGLPGIGAKVFDANTGENTLILPSKANLPSIPVAFSPDGVHLAAAGENGSVNLWDISPAGSREVLTVYNPNGMTGRISVSPDLKSFATTNPDGSVQIWNFPGGSERLRIQAHAGGVWSANFSPDGTRLVTAG